MKFFPCLTALFAKFLFIHLVKAKGDCDLLCDAKDFSRPVCGSDGKTYQSKCILRLKKCTSGKKLFVESNGACVVSASCAEERKRVFKSIKERHLLRVGIFIPECDSDGSYSEIQCSQNKLLCWCVDKHGVELDDTRVVGKRPDCRFRRSNPSPSRERYARILKGCSKVNRFSFNKKVMSSFKKELVKLSGKKGKLNSIAIAEWKMNQLDSDKNSLLNHKEMRSLIRKFKRAYSPRKCGKTFFYYCDENQNYAISKNEWLACLGIKETQDSPQCFNQQTRARDEQTRNPSTTVFIPSCNKDGTYKTVQCEEISKYCWCVHSVTGRNIPNTSVQNAKPDCSRPARKTRPISAPASISIRQLLVEKISPAKADKLATRDVNEKKKECDNVTWRKFRNDLSQMLREELELLTNARLAANSTKPRSQPRNLFWTLSGRLPDPLITAWKFSQLDVDRDRLIRDNELFSSHMKKMFGRIRRGRKCSKKLSIACDFDRNGGLSLEEWRKCLAGTFQKGFLGR